MVTCLCRFLQTQVVASLCRELRLEQTLMLVCAQARLLGIDHIEVQLIDFVERRSLKSTCILTASRNQLGNSERRSLHMVSIMVKMRQLALNGRMPRRSCVDADIDGCLGLIA